MATDNDLLTRLKHGDESAFVELVGRHNASLIGVAMGFVDSRAAAEEVVQETWLAVVEGLGRFEGRSTLSTWIFAILANKARTRAVRDKRTVPLDMSDGNETGHTGVDPARFASDGRWRLPPALIDEITPERIVAGRQLAAVVREEIERLPPRQRAVLIMRDIEHISAKEAAGILSVSEQNQRVLLHRGRTRLRQVLEDLSVGNGA